jgi:hypothetical protein
MQLTGEPREKDGRRGVASKWQRDEPLRLLVLSVVQRLQEWKAVRESWTDERSKTSTCRY